MPPETKTEIKKAYPTTEFSKEIKDANPTHIGTIRALGKILPVYTRGAGSIPLLIVGQASLFKKPPFLPASFDKLFTLYFVDLFEKSKEVPKNYSHLTLADFIDATESIRLQLRLPKMAVYGHSAAAIIAIEYAKKYQKTTSLIILVGAAPIWGESKTKMNAKFFQENSEKSRQELFDADQRRLKELEQSEHKFTADELFVHRYYARRAHFFYDPANPLWSKVWEGVSIDVELIGQYFSLIERYDIRISGFNSLVPTFLGSGLHDHTCPIYAWTDEAKAILADMEHYIFEKSAHYAHIEEEEPFSIKLLEYMLQKKLISASVYGNIICQMPKETSLRAKL